MTHDGDTGDGPDTSGFLDYIAINRRYTTPAVTAAIDAIELDTHPRPLRVLDAGTGAGGALEALASRVRPTGGHVTAIDVDDGAVDLARRQVSATGTDDAVTVQKADLHEVARQAAESGERYDLIWSSDVIWPAAFDDPAATVEELSTALEPGGTLALFTTNYYQAMLLPGHSRLERLIRTASEQTWGIIDDGPSHYERLGAWLAQAGLDVRLQVFPLATSVTDPATRDYVEAVVWPEMRHAVESRGRAAGMTDEDVARAEELLDPDSPKYAGNDDDGFVVHPNLLWTGRRTR